MLQGPHHMLFLWVRGLGATLPFALLGQRNCPYSLLHAWARECTKKSLDECRRLASKCFHAVCVLAALGVL